MDSKLPASSPCSTSGNRATAIIPPAYANSIAASVRFHQRTGQCGRSYLAAARFPTMSAAVRMAVFMFVGSARFLPAISKAVP